MTSAFQCFRFIVIFSAIILYHVEPKWATTGRGTNRDQTSPTYLTKTGNQESKRSVMISLMRTRRGSKDKTGIPTENLKGRPGQGYYIAVELGTPPQRVREINLFRLKPHSHV